MKVYLFYLVDTLLNADTYPAIREKLVRPYSGKQSVLYGWTTSKTMRKRFKKERDKKKFVERVKDMGPIELDEFSKEYSSLAILSRKLTTTEYTVNGYSSTETEVIATEDEIAMVLERTEELAEKFLGEAGPIIRLSTDINIFAKTYRDSLDIMGFRDFYAGTVSPSDGLPFDLNLVVDTWMVFLTAYLNTMEDDEE